MEQMNTWNGCRIYLTQDDITLLDVDAIVNPANSGLLGGGGLDAVIHRKGGESIAEECRDIMRERNGQPLEPGEVAVTTAGELPARYVIHALGPQYTLDTARAPEHLAAAYSNSLKTARDHGIKSIVFPCISTGLFFYPREEAAPIAVKAVREELENGDGIERVVFCTYHEEDSELYRALLIG